MADREDFLTAATVEDGPDAEDAVAEEPAVTEGDSATRPSDPSDEAGSRAFAVEVARLLADDKCQDVVIFEVRGMSPLTDYVVIGSGTSDRQIKAVAGHVAELGRETGFERLGADQDDARKWVAMDFISVMVHLFEPATRGHYDLEMLWDDAPRVSWHRG
ncbi:MAG: ribosome silencing factor [Planctomycetota bacterium]